MSDTKIGYGLVGVLALILAGSLGQFIPSEVEKMYICPLNEQVAVFDRLSSSGKTGYWTDENGTVHRLACRIGRQYAPWIRLDEYAEEQGIDLGVVFKPAEYIGDDITAGNKVWKCNITECIELS